MPYKGKGPPTWCPGLCSNTSTLLKIWDLGAEGHSWEQSAARRKLREWKPSENPVRMQREVSSSAPDWPAGSAIALGKGSRSTTRRLLVQVCWDLLAHPDPSKALVPQPPPHCRQAAGSLFYEHAKSIRNHKTTLDCRQPIAKEAKARDVAWSSSHGGAHQEVYPLGSRGGYLLFSARLC